MLNRSALLVKAPLFAIVAAGFVMYSAPPALAVSDLIAEHDKDNDKTLDLAEVKAAAGVEFDKLNKDSDDTLDRKETKGVVSKKEFKAADPDHDGTLTKDEYLSIVEKLFNKADVDHDGTLDAKELHSKAGRALEKLID